MAAFLHTEVLASLKEMVRERQEQHRTAMAKGLPVEQYWRLVGQHKECADMIDAIDKVAKDSEATLDGNDSETTRR